MRKLMIVLVAILVAAGCGSDDEDDETTEATEDSVVEGVVTLEDSDGEVGCAIARVGIGDPGETTLQSISDCSEPIPVWESLVQDGVISTDDDGEAQVRLSQGGTCGILYVFRDTNMVVSDCQRGATATSCVQSGSVGFNNDCSGVLTVQTPSATVTLLGTWVAITYDPETDITLVSIFEGAANVAPIDALDQVTVVEAGSAYFTTRDDAIPNLADIPSRTAVPVDQLPDLIQSIELGSFYAGIIDRAALDAVLPDELANQSFFNLRAGGELFDDPIIGDALLEAVDWTPRVERLTDGGTGSVHPLFGSQPGINVTEIEFAPLQSRNVLREFGIDDVEVILLYEERNARAAEALLAPNPNAEFGEGGLGFLSDHLVFEEFVVGDSLEARSAFTQLLEDGSQVLWISRS